MKLQVLGICLFLAMPVLAQDVTGRTETIENDTRPGTPTEIIAGDAGSGNAIGNKLIVINSTIQGNNSPLANASIMGGKTTTGAANENSVEVSDASTVNRNIYGGYGNTQANHNTVLITGSKVNQGASLHEEATLSAYQAERELVAGEEGYVSHSVSVDSAQVAGNLTPEESLYSVYGGVVHNGEAAYNCIIVRNSKEDGNNRPIGNNLIGAYGPYLSGTYLHDNTVEVINSQVSGLIVGGAGMGFTWEDKVRQPLRNDNNSVILTDSEVNDVIGAYGGINTNGNSIRLSGSSADNLYGVSFGQNIFYSSGNDVIDNTANNNVVVLENNSSVSGNIYGAQSHSVQASGNQINITDSNAYGNIYGVHMSNTLVQQDANTTGWNTTSATAQGNSILLQNAEAGNSSAEIAGAMNFSGAANNNAVQIAASTVTASTLAGGWAEHERQTLTAEGQQEFAIGFQADGNGVTASNSMLTANIYGGQVTQEEEINPAGDTDTTLSSASSNYVELYDSSVTGDVYGGAARGNYTRANSNRVWLSGTNIEGNVYGGLAEGADSISSNNEVVLHNTTVNGNVYGSSAAQGGGNTVTLAGQTTVSGTVYGGAGTGNQLTLLNFQSSDALSLSGFDNPYLIVGADTSVTFAQDVPEAHVIVQGIADVQGHVLARTPDANSSFILHAENSGVYTYSLVPQAEAGSGLTAWLLSGGFSQQRAESYAQTGLVALALANAGDGLLDSVIQDAAQTDQEKGSFLKTGYEHLKHETGSGFTLRATTALAGLYGRRDAWTGGLYARYAYGTYTTYPVRADSYASSWAGGAFGAWDATENLQLLADARIGWQQTSYGGSAETGASFEYEGAFTSMQAGALYALGGSWTAGGKLRWTHIRGDSMTDNLGESVYITGSDSLLGTLGLSYAAQNLAFGHFMPLARAELLHEFNGRGVSRVEGRRLNALSLRGTSGRLTLGLTYTDETKGLSAALAGFAQGGQEDGWGLKFNGSLRF